MNEYFKYRNEDYVFHNWMESDGTWHGSFRLGEKWYFDDLGYDRMTDLEMSLMTMAFSK